MQATDSNAQEPVSNSLISSILPYVLASVVFCGLPLIAFAQPPSSQQSCERMDEPHAQGDEPRPQGEMPPPHSLGMPLQPLFLAMLDLTEAQQDKLFKLMHDKALVIYENEKTARNTLRELRKLADADHFDAAKAKSLAEAHGKALAELAYIRAGLEAETRALLTDEQREQLAKKPEPPHFPKKAEPLPR